MDENADNWVALLFFLGFGLFMVVVMAGPQFHVWPQAQMFSFFSGFTWINSYLFYEIALVVFVILVDLVAAFCFLRILRRIHDRQEKGL